MLTLTSMWLFHCYHDLSILAIKLDIKSVIVKIPRELKIKFNK